MTATRSSRPLTRLCLGPPLLLLPPPSHPLSLSLNCSPFILWCRSRSRAYRAHDPGYCFRDGVRAPAENRPYVVTRVRLVPLCVPFSPSRFPSSSLCTVAFARRGHPRRVPADAVKPTYVSLSLSPPGASPNANRCTFPDSFAAFYGNSKFRWMREAKRYQARVSFSVWPVIPSQAIVAGEAISEARARASASRG